MLQNNLPVDNGQYYIYHDIDTNRFSIREDSEQEFKDKLPPEILLINAKLRVRDLYPSERCTLIKTKRMKIKELNKLGELELVSVLSLKLSKAEKDQLEQTITDYLGPDNDTDYHTFNGETDEFVIIQDDNQQLKTEIVSAVLVLDSKIDRASTSHADKRHMKTKKNPFS